MTEHACRIAASCAALVALAAYALAPRDGHADVIDPTVATTITVAPVGMGPVGLGAGFAGWPTDRGSPTRDGRVEALPVGPKPRWQRAAGGRIEYPPIVDAAGNVIVAIGPSTGSGDGALVELAAGDGAPRDVRLRTPTTSNDLGVDLGALQSDNVAAAPVLLPSGVRVVVTIRGWAIGVRPGGAIAFRTRISSELASVPRAAVLPLPSGGFVVARKPELVELDGNGAVVDRVRIDVTPVLTVRASGEALALKSDGDVVQWRASRVPRSLGSFAPVSATPCIGGLAVTSSGKHERALCITDRGVEELDLVTGKKKTLVVALLVPFRTGPALGASGEIAAVIAGGSVYGVGHLGADLGPYDIPGVGPSALSAGLSGGKDGGITYPSSYGEVAPLIANDGAVAWASADGVALVRPGSAPVRLTKCSGSVAGLASAGPGTLVVACASNEGKVELWGDAPAKK